jgi:hypothetical protein
VRDEHPGRLRDDAVEDAVDGAAIVESDDDLAVDEVAIGVHLLSFENLCRVGDPKYDDGDVVAGLA